MTNETIRIFTVSGFVFELSYDWALKHMSEHRFVLTSEKSTMKNKLDVLEYVRNLTWPEIMDEVKFVGVIEDSSQDTIKESVLDLVNDPLNYITTKEKNMKLKLSKL